MFTHSILFVEDEVNLLNSLTYILQSEGFAVTGVATGEEALVLVESQDFDLILLDISLPGIDGFEVAERILKMKLKSSTRIVMLTGSNLEDDIVTALDNYACDYIVKPVRPRVLISRLNAVLRRSEPLNGSQIISYGSLSVNTLSHQITIDGKEVVLTRTEYAILLLFLRHPNHLFSRSHIIDKVYGEDYSITERAIDFQIHCLRKKLSKMEHNLETVRGVGYILKLH